MGNPISPEKIKLYSLKQGRCKDYGKIVSADIIQNKRIMQLTYYDKKGDYCSSLNFNPEEMSEIEKKYLKDFNVIDSSD